ncbi:MAG: hypothetical protein JAZ02_17580, partial [Candidatus Thiodiazotropha endolucinida]|nr:hypothetical protein [Candidatus Thiodiazotropha endolucinida]
MAKRTMSNNESGQQVTVKALIAEEQTRLLYQQAPISNVTVYSVALLFYFILKSHIDSGIVELWVLATAVPQLDSHKANLIWGSLFSLGGGSGSIS